MGTNQSAYNHFPIAAENLALTLSNHFPAYKNLKPLFLWTFINLGVGWVE